ncbi:MAG: site-specific integrase [Chloroflexi bacterium]|nr:site-specific integrase [Chloroflexota bacterium]MCY3583589.1 site-specific integrase [Chloroflexota bacterium]MCY3715767.1 site-specific integrase [Chloroflexota bacterium]MDE2651505.1 site-specific integrase [Chloroflexota bacterium]MXV92776.1 site-specific integrase [Chloroflexota bacterium]
MTGLSASQQADLSQRQARLLRENTAVLMPPAPGKDQKSRLGFFINWLTRAGLHWYQPDLRAYRDYLLHKRTRANKRNQVKIATLSPQTALAHLATIRGRYKELARSNDIRDRLYELANPDASESEQRALVDEFLLRLANDLHPTAAPIAVVELQDRADSEHLRLKPYQVSTLLGAPGISNLRGLRDTALMTLMVCTGIRAAEAAAVHVDDLRQRLGGELALRVREGKGGKQRLIPYGPLNWCLMYADAWQAAAQIKAGAVFRRILKGNRSIGARGIGAWTVNDIMNNYPIGIDGALRLVKPHDLRRTYARNAYDFGMDLERIRQNLGHASLQTTQAYIGALDGRDRHPPNMFQPPHELAQLMPQLG